MKSSFQKHHLPHPLFSHLMRIFSFIHHLILIWFIHSSTETQGALNTLRYARYRIPHNEWCKRDGSLRPYLHSQMDAMHSFFAALDDGLPCTWRVIPEEALVADPKTAIANASDREKKSKLLNYIGVDYRNSGAS